MATPRCVSAVPVEEIDSKPQRQHRACRQDKDRPERFNVGALILGQPLISIHGVASRQKESNSAKRIGQLAEVAVSRDLFAAILGRITGLRLAPG